MGFLDRFRGAPVPSQPTLGEVLHDYAVVATVENETFGHVTLVTPKAIPSPDVQIADPGPVEMAAPTSASSPAFNEMGYTSPSPYTAYLRREYNSMLMGQRGLQKYDEMRRSDATVRGSLRMVKMPVLTGRWFVKPASDSVRDKNIADFVSWNLFEGMTTSWPQLLNEAMAMMDFGYYSFEKVFTNTHPLRSGRICWQKLAPRHPLDILGWNYDANGGPESLEMYSPGGEDPYRKVVIPISKLAVFTFDKEGGDICGMSVLRSAFKPWYYKSELEKIDAIQKERHGIGVPIIKLPQNYSPNDRRIAENLGRNLRTNERAHIVLPPGWEVEFAKLQGQPVDAMKSIEYHDKQIQKNILAPFMNEGGKETEQDLFLKASRYTADIVQGVFNTYCIPQLVNYNWAKVKAYPKLMVRQIGEAEAMRTLSFAVRNYVGAGVITPDETLENFIREATDLPPVDMATRREVLTPQDPNAEDEEGEEGEEDKKDPGKNVKPPKAGPPRQSKPKPAPTNKGGNDRSGGK
jgi:hypothetical protein